MNSKRNFQVLAQIVQVLTLGTLALLVSLAVLARQAHSMSLELYVDADYVGPETGTESQPFNTIQEAHDVSTDGVAEIIFIKAGTTNPYPSVNISRGGNSPVSPDIYTVWPGSGTYPVISDTASNLILINANFLTIDGLELDGSGGGTGDLIRANSGSYVTIRNSKVHDSATDEGIQLKNTPNAWIENVESYNNAGDGINICCGSISSTVRLNYSHNNTGGLSHGGFYFYEGGQSMAGLRVEHNVSVGNREAGINLRDVDGAIIHNNLISGTLSNGSRGAGILINDSASSNRASNNTIFNSATDGVRLDDDSGLNNTIRDNIIVSSAGYAISADDPTHTVDYNLYWQSGISETFNVITGANSLVADPLFVSGPGTVGDFYLSQIAAGQGSNSPALDSGSQTATVADLDLRVTRTDEQGDQGTVDLGYHYPALPYTLTVSANPPSIIANGISTTTLTAALLNRVGNPVPDETTVVFYSSLGYLGNGVRIYATSTSGSAAQAGLTSVPASVTVTSTVVADVYGASNQTQVPFTVPTCGTNYTDWTEYTLNPIFGQGVSGGPKAYYPSVIYSEAKFDGHGDAAYYKLWFGTASSQTGYAISDDGLNWITRTVPLTDINGYHANVLYDPGQFSGHGDAAYYKMWYWDAANSIHYATSNDGLNWANYAGNPVITNVLGLGSAPVYDAQVIYNSDGNPAFYEAWIDNNGKIYYITSPDGLNWTGDNQELLLDRESWESVTYSRVSVLKQSSVYHMWYGGANGNGGNHGIGYAVSTDGQNWVKSNTNPIFHKDDGPAWRSERTYTPEVLYDANRFDGHGSPEHYKMWFTGKQGSNYALGYATINPVHLALTTGSGQTGPVNTVLAQPFVAELLDSCNNPASGISVTFTISDTPVGASGQSLTVLSGTTDASGRVSTTLTLGDKVGTYSVLAEGVGIKDLPTTYSATATVNPVTHFSFDPIGDQVANIPFTITISARNALDDLVTTYSDSATLTDSTGTLSPTITPNFIGGVATVTVVISQAANDVVITATDGLTTGVSNQFDVTFPVWGELYLPIISKGPS
jgi:hypothetical protein